MMTGESFSLSHHLLSKKSLLPFLRAALVLCAFICLFGYSSAADAGNTAAQERIHDFHSDIWVHPDSSITVTETITVTALGQQIRRGIYRDLPRGFRDAKGRRHSLSFEITDVLRDGEAEPHHTTALSGYTRLYIGHKDRMISRGKHSYQITYRVRAALLHFQAFDELYWNITGNEWNFHIDRASTEIRLPAGAEILRHHSYTGRFGDTGQDYMAKTVKNKLGVGTTRTLSPREGLTVAVAWPKGYVVPPTATEKFRMYLRANFWLALGGALFVLLNVMYLTVWIRAGQDPEKGTIIPQFAPPDNFSPVLAHHVAEMGMDLDTAFAAAVTNLAVKGFLRIEEIKKKKEYRLHLLNDDLHDLPFSERYLIRKLFLGKNKKTLHISKKYDKSFATAMQGFEERIKREYENVYFITNEKCFTAGSLLSGLYIGAVLGLEQVNRPEIFALIIAFVIINFMYNQLLEAPTMRGRKKMDHLEGFKLYMKVAEKDRLDFLHPPEMTPALFEKFLPYAIALGVENKWAANFKKAVPKEVYDSYNPRWYRGSSSFNPSTMGSSLSGGLGAAVGGASGSSGGGSSGGGGGGGGGGGW
ncbi:MAG: DUF2207 domain-containing protein [Alphaproteobacteria bacterium]|nr:MAG: DUF2207 domain-containing protein [Alphaproteobacteria bacterium]